MTKRKELLASIAKTTKDYREAELASPTLDHIDRWVAQFDKDVQLPILSEMDHVLGKTYISRANTKTFLKVVLQSKKLVGDDPCAFWRGVKFLDIQQGGASQKEMLALLSGFLKEQCGYGIEACGKKAEVFFYLDDAIFTGNRVRRDFEEWIAKEAPAKGQVHICVLALHSQAHYYASTKIAEAAKKAGKKLEFTWWKLFDLENKKSNADSSDVLWPVAIPANADVQAYITSLGFPPHLRTAGQVGARGIFSSDAGRQLLEGEFLKAGVRIRQMCPNLGDTQRPLGHATLKTVGFGSLIVTFRNCPNNAPLALWVGAPWHPLFARTTNSDTSMKQFMAMLAKE